VLVPLPVATAVIVLPEPFAGPEVPEFTTVQLKVVPATDPDSCIVIVSPSVTSKELGVAITSGIAFTVTTTCIGVP
jgi:hypothetical protein